MAKILYYGGDKLEHPGIGDVVYIPSYRYDVDRGLGLGMQVIKISCRCLGPGECLHSFIHHATPIRCSSCSCICCLYPLLMHPPLLTVEGRWTPVSVMQA